MTAPRDCDHGSLARVCLTCELQAELKGSKTRELVLEESRRSWKDLASRREADAWALDIYRADAVRYAADRDRLAARCQRQTDILNSQAKLIVDDRCKHTQIYVRNTELVKEVDCLAATVAAVRTLIATGSYTFSREQLARALADGEALGKHERPSVIVSRCQCHGCPSPIRDIPHGYGKCVERRENVSL